MSRYLEVHVLQPMPFSCINRDDAGMPKSMALGSVRRGRWSSQSQKHNLRNAFPEDLNDNVSLRTRRLPLLAINLLVEGGADPVEAADRVFAAVGQAGGIKLSLNPNKAKTKTDDDAEDEETDDGAGEAYGSQGLYTGRTQVILPIRRAAAAELAAIVTDNWDELLDLAAKTEEAKAAKARVGKAVKDLLSADKLIDVALFGRMLSEIPSQSVDASASVAHAFTTHADDLETDFWSAVDDLAADQGHGGSANMGTQAFTSGCFYRYAVVDLDGLRKSAPLAGEEDLIRRGVAAFVDGFIRLRPTAMQRSTAPYADPAVVIVAATDMQRHLGDAFIAPVEQEGYLEGSALKLSATWDAWAKAFGVPSSLGHVTLAHPDVDGDLFTQATRHATVAETVNAALSEAFSE